MVETLRARRGWTLVELMAVIGILAAIAGLLFPALATAHRTSCRGASMAHQSQVAQALMLFAHDNDDRTPYWGVPGTELAPLIIGGQVITTSHWAQPTRWGAFLESRGYDGWQSRLAGCGVAKHVDRPTSLWTGSTIHWLSHTLYTRDQYWTKEWERSPRDCMGRRMIEVSFPSDKGIMFQVGSLPEGNSPEVMLDPRTRWIVSFADGHVESPRYDSLRPGIPSPYATLPIETTIKGLQGRDR